MNRGIAAAWALLAGLALTVSQGVFAQTATNTQLTVSPTWSTQGQQVTLTATVTGNSPSGQVTFKDGNTVINSKNLNSSGVATYSVSNLALGSHTLTATYAGNASNASSSGSAEHVVKTATTTSISATPNSPTVGQSVTLTATVSGGTPTGLVTFFDGSTTLGTANLSGSTAIFTVSAPAGGSHSFKATYGGDENDAQSSSNNANVSVGKASTTTTLSSSLNPSAVGDSVTLTATVNGYFPTGTVTFKEGTTTLGTGSVSGGVATFTTSTFDDKVHSITATYGGDTNNSNSTSVAFAQTVTKANVIVGVSSNVNPGAVGQAITLTATVTGQNPTGSIKFFDGGTQLSGWSNLSGTGNTKTASITVSNLAAGTHQITAQYNGDSNNAGKTSPAYPQDIKTAATIQVTRSAASVPYGQPVTFTATVTGLNPTGTVTFVEGASNTLGAPSLAGSGNSRTASVTVSNLAKGNRTIAANYAGDGLNLPISGSIGVNIEAANPTITLSTSAPSPTYGQPITWTATIINGNNPTGTVTFKDGNVALSPVSSVTGSGVATYVTSTLSGGSHSITASYSGDPANAPADTQSAMTQNVNRLATNTTLSSTSTGDTTYGQSITWTAMVTGANPGGNVTFKDNGTTLDTRSLTAGSASFTSANLGFGNHTITLEYAGDTNNAPSSANVPQNITKQDTNVTLVTSPNPSSVGQLVTLTAAVTGYNTAGAVTFRDGGPSGTVLGEANVSAGSASISVPQLTLGSHTLTAVYAGDGNHNGNASNAPQTVNQAAATTALAAVPAQAVQGENVTLTASIAGYNPTGTVTFREGSTTLGSASVANGVATFSTSVLALGVHSIVADYSGDANNTSGTSAGTTVSVGGRTGFIWQFGYDALGRPNTVIDPNNLETYAYYDSLGRPVQLRQPANTGTSSSTLTNFGYDLQDSLTLVTDPRNLNTTYTPDGLGNVKGEQSPDRGGLTYAFDKRGNLKTSTDARGKTTVYTYDESDRIKTITYAGGTPTVFEYDGGTGGAAKEAGELTRITDESGSTTYEHDALGRLTKKTVVIAGRTFVVDYGWGDSGSALDKLTRITYPSGAAVNYGYDAKGMINSITITPSGGSQQTLLNNVIYNADGNVASWQWNDGKPRTIGYDSVGMISSYTLGDPTGAGNKAGTLRTVIRDAAGRIMGYTHSNGQSSLDQGFAYDGLNRLTSQTVNGTTYGFTYDATGNRTSKVVGGTTYTNTVSATSNKYTQTQDVAGNATPQYDSAGNMTNDGVSAFTYGDRGRMSSATTPVGNVVFLFNGLQQRAYKNSPLGSISYLYDEAGQLLGEYDGNGNALFETAYLASMPVGVLKQGTIYNVHADQIATPRVITQQDHTIVWRWDTAEAFGATSPTQDPSGVGAFVYNIRFPGQVFDLETGLNQNWNREYNAAIGRYLQSDPIGLDGGVNPFAYSVSQPTALVDPKGLLFGFNAGESYGDSAAQYWADKQQRTGNWAYAIPGVLASLWTPCTSTDAALTLLPPGALGRAVPGLAKFLPNGVKGQIGEALSIANNWIRGNTLVDTQVRIPGFRTVVDTVWRSAAGAAYYVESKFGTANLTKAQRAARKELGDAVYRVERWTYEWLGKAGAVLGATVGGAAALSSDACSCR